MKKTFTDEQKLTLKSLNEYVLLYTHQIRRLVGFYAEQAGVDVEKNTVAFDLDTMTYTVEPLPKKEDKKD